MKCGTMKDGKVWVEGRISYPKLFEPKAVKNDPNARPRYGAAVLVSKDDTESVKLLKTEIKKIVDEKAKGAMPPGDKLPMKDGDGDYGDEHSKGCVILSANRQEDQGPPKVYDQFRNELTREQSGEVLAGYVVRLIVSFYYQAKWKRVCCGLEGVQLVRKAEVIGAPPVSADALPDIDTDAADEGWGDEDEEGDY